MQGETTDGDRDATPWPDVPWAAGEVVRFLVDLGAAVQEQHAAGRGHGFLGAPEAWAVSPSGRAVLTGPARAGARPCDDVRDLARAGLGLLGRLPEECVALPDHLVASRPRGGEAGRPADEVRGRPPQEDEGLDDLVPTVPGCASDDVPRERLRHVLLLVAGEDAATTDVELLMTQALAVADPVPVRGADAAVLARDALVRSAGVVAPPDRGRHRRRGPARGVLAPCVAGTAVLVAGLAVLVLLGRGGAVPADAAPQGAPTGARVLASGPSGEPLPSRATGPDARLEGEVVVLTRTRATALAHGDLLRLLGVTVPGSPAALADLTQLARRADPGGVAVPTGLPSVPASAVGLRVDQVTALPPSERGARVLLVAAVGAGEQPADARGVVLTLSPVAGSWRVVDVEPADGDPGG